MNTSSNKASSRLAQYTTRAQVLNQLQLQQQQQQQQNRAKSPSSSSLLLPASRWLARKVSTGVIQPLPATSSSSSSLVARQHSNHTESNHHHQISISTISSDINAPGTVCVRSDTSDGKRLANIARLKVFGENNSSSRPTTPTRTTNMNAVHVNSSLLSANSNEGSTSSSSLTVTAITTIPKDHSSGGPGEVWVAWSNGTVSILNDTANKVLTTLPSIASTCGTIVEMFSFYSGSTTHSHLTVVGAGGGAGAGNQNSFVSLQERKRQFQQQQAFGQSFSNTGGAASAHPASSSSATSTICDGTWLFGRHSKYSRCAVMIFTSSGTLLCIDTRSRSLMFRVPPNQTPRTSLVKCATALTDDTRTILLLATEDCLIHALELTISEAADNSKHKRNTQQQQQQNTAAPSSAIVCVPRIIQVLSVAPPGVNVELECCPLSIATSTKLLRDSPVPTIFVGFLTGHACFFKLIFTGRTDLHSSQEILDPHLNDDSYMLLYNQSTGMTLAHNFQDPVVKVIPIHQGGSSCITVSSSASGACVFSISSPGVVINNQHHHQYRDEIATCWNPIQRVENFNFHQGTFPIGGTALSSNEVVILLSDGGLRRLLVANPEPEDEDDELENEFEQNENNIQKKGKMKSSSSATNQQQNTNDNNDGRTHSPLISPTRRRQQAAARRQQQSQTQNLSARNTRAVKKVDPVTGQEYELPFSDHDNANVLSDDENISSVVEERGNNLNQNNNTNVTATTSRVVSSSRQDSSSCLQEQDFFPSPHLKDVATGRNTNTQQQQQFNNDSLQASYERGRLSGIIKGRPQRAFHDLSVSEETERMHKQRLSPKRSNNKQQISSTSPSSGKNQQHGFWGNSNNNNENSSVALYFKNGAEFVDRAMFVADAIQRLYTSESNFRQALSFEQDSDLGFLWHLHQSASLGKRFVKNQEEVMKPLYNFIALERETRMKDVIIPFFTSHSSLFLAQTVARRRAELLTAEREERKRILQEDDDQFYFLFYSLMSNFSPKRQRNNNNNNNDSLLPSAANSSSSNNNNHAMTLLEKQITRERATSEAVARQNEKLTNTIQTLQSLLREEQQKNNNNHNSIKKKKRISFSGLSSDDDDENTPPPPMTHQQHSSSLRETLLLREQVTALHEKLSAVESNLLRERREHERELEIVMESARKQIATATTISVSPPRPRSPLSSPIADQQQQQQQQHVISDLRRALQDEQIRRSDVERSLEIVSVKLDKLVSAAAQSEAESRDHRVKAEALDERLRLTSSELQDCKKELSEMRRYEDLARKFEREFTLRDEQYVKVLRERDMILLTSDQAVATVEEQQATIRELNRSTDSLRRSARKLLALCDIAVSVGSEPPGMSSLRKFLRETMMECATLKKYDGMPLPGVERIHSIYERSAAMQDHLFSPVNPSMVVLDKSEAIQVMANLRRALEQ